MTEREISRMAIRIVRRMISWTGLVLHIVSEGLLTLLAILILLIGAIFIIVKDGYKLARRLRRKGVVTWRRRKKL